MLVGRGSHLRGVALQLRQHQLQRRVELRVRTRGPRLRREGHLHVRVHAVVLHRPPPVHDPGGVARLGHGGAVDQVEPPVDAHHPTPAAHPHHRAEAALLDHRRDDVAVGARVLVGDRHERAAPDVVGVGARPLAAGHAPPGELPGELLHHQLRGVPATIAAHVQQHRVGGDLGVQVPVQLRPAQAHHVRHVQVAHPAARRRVDHLAAPRHPVEVAQRHLLSHRHHHHGALRAVHVPQPQLDGRAGGADEQRAGAPDGIHLAPVHGDHGRALDGADPRAAQRGAPGGRGRLTGQHAGDAPEPVRAVVEVHAEVAQSPGRGHRALGRGLVGVRGAELAVDLPDEVGQVVPGGQSLDQRAVALEHARPVVARHVGHPEVVAHEAPRLVQHLPPLRPGDDQQPHAG